MKILFLLIPAVFIVGLSYGQDLKTVQVPLGARPESKKIIDGVTTHNYTQGSSIPVNGNPYFKEAFSPGVLELYDGAKSSDVPMRYNAASDAFEIIQGQDTLTLNQPLKVKQIYYADQMYIYDPELREKPERKYNGFFQLRVNGELSLYIKRSKDLVFDSFASNYQGGSGTKEYYYVDKVSFVGRYKGKKGFLITSRRSFLKHVEENGSEIRSFIKKNKIKFKDEEDLVKLVEFYNNI